MDKLVNHTRNAQKEFKDKNSLSSMEKLLKSANQALRGGCSVAFRVEKKWFDLYIHKDKAAFESNLTTWAKTGGEATSIGTGFKTYPKPGKISRRLQGCIENNLILVERLLDRLELDEESGSRSFDFNPAYGGYDSDEKEA